MSEIPEKGRIYSEEEAAALLKMTPRMLADRRRAFKISCNKDQAYISYTGEQLLAYLSSHVRRGTQDEFDQIKVREKRTFRKRRPWTAEEKEKMRAAREARQLKFVLV